MMSLRLVAKDITPEGYAKNIAKVSSSPGAAYSLPGGQAGYDTLIVIKGGGGLEFSIFRIASQESSAGIKVLQYSEKIPPQKMTSIGVSGFKTLKTSHRESIKAAAFPSISVTGN